MNKRFSGLPELLAPAGSADALEAAVLAGADAVYFGGERFSARARAANINAGEMPELLAECRARGVKTYGAVNIKLYDGEMDDALRLASQMLDAGIDGLIVGDIGFAARLRREFPGAPLHASTQLCGTSVADAEVFASLGFSRMVCPRELTLPEITRLCRRSPIGIEMFVHGAHCVSVSGRCSMSCVMGGRSGNRGDCAGPCRLPFSAEFAGSDRPRDVKYRYDDKGRRGRLKQANKPARADSLDDSVYSDHILSLKDMCLASHIREIISSGVLSLKIEGRLKGAAYVGGVVGIYRRLLDERRDASPDEIAELDALFSRGGSSDGYFTGNYGGMLGVRDNSEIGSDRVQRTGGSGRNRSLPPVPLRGKLRMYCGERAKLELDSPIAHGDACGDSVLLPANGHPPPKDSLRRSIGKLGSTPFYLESLDIDTDGRCGISASVLNALRREAVSRILRPPLYRDKMVGCDPESHAAPEVNSAVPAEPVNSAGSAEPTNSAVPAGLTNSTVPATRPIRAAILACADQIGLADGFDEIYLPMADFLEFDGTSAGLALPEVTYDRLDVSAAVEKAAALGAPVLAHTAGQLAESVRAGAYTICSHGFAVYNAATAGILARLGASCVTISPEIGLGHWKNSEYSGYLPPLAVISGGRIPLMVCRRCPASDGGAHCPHMRSGGFDGKSKSGICRSFLRDRTGAVFPAVGDRYCMTSVYNSVPTVAEIPDETLISLGIVRTFFVFSTEPDIIKTSAYRKLR